MTQMEQQRINHINDIMNRLYESAAKMYEALVDFDEKDVRDASSEIKKVLREVEELYTD